MPRGRGSGGGRAEPRPPSPAATQERDDRERNVVVLFCDIVGCSEISNHKTLSQYNEFLREFHDMFKEVTNDHRTQWYPPQEHEFFQTSVRGDEGVLMIFIPQRRDEDLAKDVDTAIYAALDLKRRWLLTADNQDRIRKVGLLPTDLAIGIHLGKVFVNEGPQPRPEGYTINLTKRIESESRSGQFTHIYVSEAARGQLHLLTDEVTYSFSPRPHVLRPKGISRDICAFEVKHHFLPADWKDEISEFGNTRALRFIPDRDELEIARQAYHENPTNLWLAEEYIALSMRYEFSQLSEKDQDDPAVLKATFSAAEEVSRRLSFGEKPDAETFAIQGLIAGERGSYAGEQEAYENALRENRAYADGYWYKASSISAQLRDELAEAGQDDPHLDDLTQAQMKRLEEIKKCLRTAISINGYHAWYRYDLACELARFGRDKRDQVEAAELLRYASTINASVKPNAQREPDFGSIRHDKNLRAIFPEE